MTDPMKRITFPDTSKNRDAGITYKDGIAYARYTEDGRQKRRKIGEESEPHVRVRELRDAFHAELLAAGAKVTSKGPKPGDLAAKRRQRVAADPMKYIRFEEKVTRAPWSVRLGSRVVGRFKTAEAARKARDRAVGVKTNAIGDARADNAAPLHPTTL